MRMGRQPNSMNDNLELARQHFELALTALNKNDLVQAEKELRQALCLSPQRPSILVNLSVVLIRQQKWLEAKNICSTLLTLDPRNVEGIVNFGVCEHHLENSDGALHSFNEALSINPNSPLAWVNKANILLEREEFDDARYCYENALNIGPKLEEALIGLGSLHNELKEYELGLAYFSKTLEINPNSFQAQWNKSLSLLRLGQYEEGWKLYEARWHIPGMMEHAKHQSIPLWLGNIDLAGKTILIHAEQGFGDAIQMSRYLPMLSNEMGANVIYEVHPALIDLMSTLDPKIQVVSSYLPLHKQIKKQPDFQCPIMSMPLAFKTKLESIPTQTPYLKTDPKRQLFWRNRLQQLSPADKAFRVGITWSGSGHYAGKKNSKRDISFENIKSLLNELLPYSIEFHAIQKEIRADWMLDKPKNLFMHHNLLTCFADSAALIGELDLIVSIDTAVGHLSGALGQKTLVLIPDPSDFMTMTEINHSPWYPKHSLIRQEHRGIWPINQIKAELLKAVLTKEAN